MLVWLNFRLRIEVYNLKFKSFMWKSVAESTQYITFGTPQMLWHDR